MCSEDTYILGSAVKITCVLTATPQTITVTVKDPTLTSKVTDVNMTLTATGIYTYIFQTLSTDLEGDYVALVKMVFADGTSYEKIEFTMEKQPE